MRPSVCCIRAFFDKIIKPSVNAMAATYALAVEDEELGTVQSPLAETRINRFLHIAGSAAAPISTSPTPDLQT